MNSSGTTVGSFSRTTGSISALILTRNFEFPTAVSGNTGPGVQIGVLNSVWAVSSVLAGSGAWDGDIQADDVVVSINGVNVPATNATHLQLSASDAAMLAARSGSVDSYVIERGGTRYTRTGTVAALGAMMRESRTMALSDILEALRQTRHNSGAGCWDCDATFAGIDGVGCKKKMVGYMACSETLDIPAEWKWPENPEGATVQCQTPGPENCWTPTIGGF